MTTGISQNEQVYRAIKAELLEGRYLPGQRLESRILSERHASSSTPVRMALSHLAGERIVEVHANDGFHVPMVTEKSVHDLYLATKLQLEICLQLVRPDWNRSALDDVQVLAAPVTALEALFAAIATATENSELRRIILGLNDRSHLFRDLETKAANGFSQEVQSTCELWRLGDLPALQKRLATFHKNRIRNAREIVKLVYLPRVNE